MNCRLISIFSLFLITKTYSQTFNTFSIIQTQMELRKYSLQILMVMETLILYFASQEDKLGLLKNDGSENFTDFVVNSDMNSITDIEVSDLDDDGDLDIIVTNYSGDYKVAWL